jgi:hypothetical protein
MNNYVRVFTTSVLPLLACMPSAQAEWHYGIGTGISGLSADGDIGAQAALFGAVKGDVDLDAGDTADLMDTAFGFGGYATNGKLKILYSLGQLNLEGDAKSSAGVKAELDFDKTTGEIIVSYPVIFGSEFTLGVLGGLRYTEHDIESKIDGSSITKIKNDWTDVLVGVSTNLKFAGNWAWGTQIDAGFGGSEGTYEAKTSLTWMFAKQWSATAAVKYLAVDFEEDSQGDPNWYLYDVDETTIGLSFLYHW